MSSDTNERGAVCGLEYSFKYVYYSNLPTFAEVEHSVSCVE